MTEVVPAILTDSAKEFKELAERMVSAGIRRAHLDIADGSFVSTKTISGYKELMELDVPLDWDVHLMVQRPEEMIDHWWGVPRANRFIMHAEATDMFPELIKHAHEHEHHIGAALNPGTSVDMLDEYVQDLDSVQFMTVIPGRQGASFQEHVLESIKKFHAQFPNVVIAVDGGITPDTAPRCTAAGATLMVSGSYIIGSGDMRQAVQELEASVIE